MTDPAFWKATGWAALWISIFGISTWIGWKLWAPRGAALGLGLYMWFQDIFRRDRRIDR